MTGTGKTPPACCDRCGGEFAPRHLADGLCAGCREHLRARDAREAARWAKCEACGKALPIRAGRVPRWCPECRKAWEDSEDCRRESRERDRLRKARSRRGVGR